MEPKKDDPETISGQSDRSIENVVFLLNCPFYGAQFNQRKIAFCHQFEIKKHITVPFSLLQLKIFKAFNFKIR